SDVEMTMVSCASWQGIVGAVNKAKRALPLETRKRLADVFSSYLARYGLEGTYERMNGRSGRQIFAEYQSEDVKPIVSGQIDGMRYELYEPPPRHPADDEPQPDA